MHAPLWTTALLETGFRLKWPRQLETSVQDARSKNAVILSLSKDQLTVNPLLAEKAGNERAFRGGIC
jgi:hypothetical protein